MVDALPLTATSWQENYTRRGLAATTALLLEGEDEGSWRGLGAVVARARERCRPPHQGRRRGPLQVAMAAEEKGRWMSRCGEGIAESHAARGRTGPVNSMVGAG